MGADVVESCGGVDVKPTSNGRVHAIYAATLCKKPRLTTERYLYTSRQRKEDF